MMRGNVIVETWEKFQNFLKRKANDFSINPEKSERPLQDYMKELHEERRMEKQLKIMTLGYTTTGKTYYLGSINNLRRGTKPHCFTLQADDYTKINTIQKISLIMRNQTHAAVPGNVRVTHTMMKFQRSMKELFAVDFVDVEGEAIEAGKNSEVAQMIINEIGECDAVVLLLKVPTNTKEVGECLDQLPQLFNFSKEVLKKKSNTPIVLIINQIDVLPKAQGISKRIEEAIKSHKKDVKGVGQREQYEKQLEVKRGEASQLLLKDIFYTDEIYQIIDQFTNWVRNSDYRFPNRIFFSSSIGFDNTTPNSIDEKTLIAKTGDIKPFGSIASLLWTLYATLIIEEDRKEQFGLEDNLLDQLLDDCRYLHVK